MWHIKRENEIEIKPKLSNAHIEYKEFGNAISAYIKNMDFIVKINDETVTNIYGEPIIENDTAISIPYRAAKKALDGNLRCPKKKKLVMEFGDKKVVAVVGKEYIIVNKEKVEVEHPLYFKESEEGEEALYIPFEILEKGLDAEFEYKTSENTMYVNIPEFNLPSYYNLEDSDRIDKEAKDQTDLGTCWAFATIGALESNMLPDENKSFSEDHISINNKYGREQKDGGVYTIAWSYLASWLGPVYEKDDPYGDGVSPDNLKAVKHVQEMQMVKDGDLTGIKQMVYKYGGVQSSIYFDNTNYLSYSEYYNIDNASYYYDGEEEANHEILIIGWDDNYDKNKFNQKPAKNGAFICRNSWGEDFGDSGNFYVSYEDAKIALDNEVFTRIDDNDNYDNIYEYDECGFCGTLGFSHTKTAMAANVFAAKNDEILRAMSFYTTKENTGFECFVCSEYKGTAFLSSDMVKVAEGKISNIGYYTVDFDGIDIKKDTEYAVIIKMTLEEEGDPIAIECKNSLLKGKKITNGKGYYSVDGVKWTLAEDSDCDLCIKAFTDNKE